MIVKQMVLVLTASEIGMRIGAALAGVAQISEPVVRLADGQIELDGVFKAGLSIPFGTSWTAEVRPGNCVALRLAKFNAGMFGGNALGGQVLGMLAAKLDGRVGLKVEGDSLVLALNPLLAQHAIALDGALTGVAISPAGVEIRVA